MKNVINFKALLIILSTFSVPGLGNAASLLEVYQQALQGGAEHTEALRAIVDWLAEQTLAGT